jgi:aspartyl-tRNA(Asn)/glutamyl-tRNA(Gln) amidotransferase subunit B
MRTKEEANDYRYFPDPDLLPVVIEEGFIEDVKKSLPELPDEKIHRFTKDYGLNAYDASVMVANRDMAEYFDAVAKATGEPKAAANWVMGDLTGALNKSGQDIKDSPVTAAMLAGMINRIKDGTLTSKTAKIVFEAMWNGEGEADQIIEAKDLKPISDTGAIEKIIDDIIAANPEQVEQYRGGKEKVFGFFVGQVMKASKGKANPQQVNELLKKKLAG